MNDAEFGSSDAAKLGGKARAAALTPDERSAISSRAAAARWEKVGKQPKRLVATHGSPDHPLRIGDLEIPCYVLDNGMRVLTQDGMLLALGLSRGSAGASTRSGIISGDGTNRLMRFVAGKRLSSFISEQLREGMTNPIRFRSPLGIKEAHGYEATLLPDICDAVLSARQAGALLHQQEPVAARCEILVRAFARVGIVALVDEATGYQYERPQRELEEQLKKFLAEGLVRYVSGFPREYLKHLCRLRGVELRPDMRLPQYFGHLTNDLVYRRIAPGLVQALKERRSDRGRPSNKLYQWTSEDVGYPALMLHLGTVVGLMKINTDYEKFKSQLDVVAPPFADVPGLFDNATEWEKVPTLGKPATASSDRGPRGGKANQS